MRRPVPCILLLLGTMLVLSAALNLTRAATAQRPAGPGAGSAPVPPQSQAPLAPWQGTPTPTPGCVPSWDVAPSPDGGTQTNRLQGVAAHTAGDAWAVGYAADPTGPARSL